LLDQVDALRYVTAPNAPTYRAVMEVCCEALAHYRIELSPSQILHALREGGYVVEVEDADELEVQVLAQLERWGNIAHTADPQGVDRLEDFYRRRLVYHVTDVGEAAHAAVREVEAAIGQSGSLQTNMLVKLGECLPRLVEAGVEADAEQLLRLLHDVHTAFGTLTHEANRFMVDLGRLVGEERGQASPERFAAFKRAVLAYISRFVQELRSRSEQIAEDILRVTNAGIDAMIETASRSADLPDFAEDGAARSRWAERQRERWMGVTTWFVGDGDSPATVDRLAGFAVGAVLSLTRTLARLNDRRGRPVDRTSDFLKLAQWFEASGTDAAAHALWHTAFGLHVARHFHLAEEDAELGSTRSSWWEGEPVEVPARLRTHGREGAPGRLPRAADHSRARRWLAQRARRERAQVEAATARFAGRTLRLSDVDTLDASEFDLLLVLLDAALTTPADEHGVRRTRTADGRVEVALHPAQGSAICTLDTPAGRLRAPDMTIAVTEVSGRPLRAARETSGVAG
jgi:uncharacterized protein (TIGR02677 family)